MWYYHLCPLLYRKLIFVCTLFALSKVGEKKFFFGGGDYRELRKCLLNRECFDLLTILDLFLISMKIGLENLFLGIGA